MCALEIGSTAPSITRNGTLAVLQRRHPALTLLAAVDDVADQAMHHPLPLVAFDQAPEGIQLGLAGPAARAEDLGEVARQGAAVEQPAEQPAQRAQQQLLAEHRAVRFREQPTIEEHAGGEPQPAFVMAGEQFPATLSP